MELPPPPVPHVEESTSARSGLLGDIEAYYTAPLHWDARDWEYFAGTLAAIGIADHFDTDVRTHFMQGQGAPRSSDDLQDALPAASLVVGTYLYSWAFGDHAGWTAGWNMVEAAGLASVTNYALAYATGRQRPYQTSDPNRWEAGGSSFPSLHVTATFAIGTVFAESGDEEHVWLTRFAGYGLAAYTAYLRLKHDQHWFSDTVAGAALGASTAVFVLHRSRGREGFSQSQISVDPLPAGAMIAYHTTLPY